MGMAGQSARQPPTTSTSTRTEWTQVSGSVGSLTPTDVTLPSTQAGRRSPPLPAASPPFFNGPADSVAETCSVVTWR